MRHLPSYRATITSKEKVDLYGGHEAASINKASKTDMFVRFAAGWFRWERLIRRLFDFLACLRQQLVSKSTAKSACGRSLLAPWWWGCAFGVPGLLQGHGVRV
jgi:hypothetical protein